MKYFAEYGGEVAKLKENSVIIAANEKFQEDRPLPSQGENQPTPGFPSKEPDTGSARGISHDLPLRQYETGTGQTMVRMTPDQK